MIKGTFGIVFKSDICAFILLSGETKMVDLDCRSCHGQDYRVAQDHSPQERAF